MWQDGWRMKIWIARKVIDAVDPLMMKLLSWRMRICKGIGKVKIKHKLPIHVPQREKEILRKRQAQAKQLGFSEKFIRILAKVVFSESKRIQKELAKA